MLSAYVLIQTEVGTVAKVAQAICDLDGVERADDLAGPTTSSLWSRRVAWTSSAALVVPRIQAVDGVTPAP
jgi:hypothetical protein